MRYNARALLTVIGGVIMGVFLLSACQGTDHADTRPQVLESPRLEVPQFNMGYDLGPVDHDAYKAYEAPAPVEVPHVAPKALEPSGKSAPTRKALEGDDNHDGRIDEDESGWDCKTMGNKRCGPEPDTFEYNDAHDPNRGKPGYVQAEDGSWVPTTFYDKPAKSKALEPTGKACRGKAGSDIGSGDDDGNGWITPGESGYASLC